jgi:L-2-hydroxyglutarate oxidase LhgO
VGAGIVGLTVAYELLVREPHLRVAILEKESAPGLHASSRNSGVIHSGIYYPKHTLKAKLSVQGAERMIAFARSENIAFNPCGKVILATSEEQLPTVAQLLRNAEENNIEALAMDEKQLLQIEPYAASAPGAIYVPKTAVIDSSAVVARLREKVTQRQGIFLFNSRVLGLRKPGLLETTRGLVHYSYCINCAGAYADVIAKTFGLASEYLLLPFKGIYWKLQSQIGYKVRGNIYPVPDLELPFLGVHFTRSMEGTVYVGPTAIPALGRENYRLFRGIKLHEFSEILPQLLSMWFHDSNNFRNLAYAEVRKYRKRNLLQEARKLVPSLTIGDIVPAEKVGIRPQLVNLRTKRLEMDYIVLEAENSLHVLNAVSPAFTSSFAFAEWIVNKVLGVERLQDPGSNLRC